MGRICYSVSSGTDDALRQSSTAPISHASGTRMINGGISVEEMVTGSTCRKGYSGDINANMHMESISDDIFSILSQTHMDNVQKISIHAANAI